MEKFSLKWNDFQQNVTNSFQRLRQEKDYSDVTLIGDDYQPLLAHKVVLSSSSEYFKNVLYSTRNHSNPVICMEGLKKGDLTNILDYIYNGELQIYQEDLDKFLTIAERLKLEGLTGQEAETDDEKDIQSKNEAGLKTEVPSYIIPEIKQNQPKPISQGLDSRMVVIQSGDLSDKELNKRLDEFITLDPSGMYTCNFCSKNTKNKGHLREHVEIHVDGLQFPCKFCDKTYRSRGGLRSHVSKDHGALI